LITPSRKCGAHREGRKKYRFGIIYYKVTHLFAHSNLLGAREDPLLAVYARRISEKIVGLRPPTSAEPFPTIVLAVSIHKEKGKDPEMFGLLVDLLVQLYRDAVTGMQ
jgi:hypothetical protein